MTFMTHDVQKVALGQLETALRLYFEGEDYYSVTTLAGASEEIFEQLLLDTLLTKLEADLRLYFEQEDYNSVIDGSDKEIGKCIKELKQLSGKLTNDIKSLKNITSKFPKEPEEVWDSNQKLRKARTCSNNLKCVWKDIEKVSDRLSDELKQVSYKKLEELNGELRDVFGRYKPSSHSLVDTVVEINKLPIKELGDEDLDSNDKTPSESDILNRKNWIRNILKHWLPGQPKEVNFDAQKEAKDMLDLAIGNYYSLTEIITPTMERFQNMHVQDNK